MIREGTMGAAVALRTDFSAGELRQLAKRAEDADQARRLLSLAAVRDGMSRQDAAKIGGMDRQTLRDWVHRFNEKGPAGLINGKAPGAVPKLSAEQKQELKGIVETGPDPVRDGVVRWRCVDLKRVIKERFDVDLDEVSIGRVLKELGFAHVSPRPRHPKPDPQAIEAFKKTFRPGWRR
jgi:transposase